MELMFRPEYKSIIRYKFSYVDLRALTTASTVLGFTSYPSLYYAIFVSLRALTGGLKYGIAMMAVPILGLLQLITWSSGPGTGDQELLPPGIHYTIPKSEAYPTAGGRPSSTSNTPTIGLLLITSYPLAYTLHMAYKQSKHQEPLHPVTATLALFIAVATLIPSTPLTPRKQTTT